MHRTLDGISKHFSFLWTDDARMPLEIPGTARADLGPLFSELGFKIGAEIGVEQGEFTETLCRSMSGLQKLFAVDAWQHYKGYRDHVNQDKLDRFYETTKKRLEKYPVWIIREFSLTAARRIKNGTLDFVYIDANHDYRSVVDDIHEWSQKVRPGGIVAGHDYREVKNDFPIHVVPAVQGYVRAYRIKPWFLLGTKDQPGRDTSRSWFWVKEGGGVK